MTLDDRTARVDVTVFADLFQSCRDICVDDQLVVVDGDVSFDEFSQGLKMRATKVDTLAAARHSSASALEMTLAVKCQVARHAQSASRPVSGR